MAASSYEPDESFLPAYIYNTIPRINLDEVDEQEKRLTPTRNALLKAISDHGMEDIFSLHLLHRHYDLPSNSAMVYEQSPYPASSELPFFEICRPRCINSLDTMSKTRGKFFFYRRDIATMSAYEYTTEIGPSITSATYAKFIHDFTHQLLLLKMEDVFALSISPSLKKGRILHEIEIPAYRATLRLEKASWVPDGFSTDWASLIDEVDLITKLNLGNGRDKHLVQRKGPIKHIELEFVEPLADSSSIGIVWDDEMLDKESTAYKVVLKARELIIS